jgi:zinc transporter 9
MPILILLAQCLAMFAASVVAGNLPLMFKSTMVGKCSSKVPIHDSTQTRRQGNTRSSGDTDVVNAGRRLQMISTTGMGILVGAALTIIIPE